MAKSTIFSGAKAKLFIDNKLVGVFTSCTYSVSYDLAPAYILGRHGVAEFTYTGMAPVSLNLTGYRVIGSGPYAINVAPELKELISHSGVLIKVVDRETDKDILSVLDCFCSGYSTGFNSRSVSDVSFTLLGRSLSDETTDGSEPSNDTKIGDGSPSS
jgi:hypothetical protein